MCIFVPKYIWMVDHFISHPAYKSGSYIFFVIYINVWYNIAHVVYIKNNVVFLFLKTKMLSTEGNIHCCMVIVSTDLYIMLKKTLRVWLSLVTLSLWGCDKLWSLIVRRCLFYLVLHCSKVSWTVRHYLFMIIHSWGFFFLLLVIVFHLRKEEIISFPPPNFKIYLLFFFKYCIFLPPDMNFLYRFWKLRLLILSWTMSVVEMSK